MSAISRVLVTRGVVDAGSASAEAEQQRRLERMRVAAEKLAGRYPSKGVGAGAFPLSVRQACNIATAAWPPAPPPRKPAPGLKPRPPPIWRISVISGLDV